MTNGLTEWKSENERQLTAASFKQPIIINMKLYIYMEYVADGHPICGYYDGIKDYEAQKRHCKRKGYKITEAYVCAYETNPENPFEWGERIADTKKVDCI